MRSSPARHAFAALGALLLAAAVLSASGQQSPRELYERARLLDEGGQNLAEVIRLYGQVADLAKDQPALAARALVQMGRCQERLGQAEARKAYQRVIDEYPGQQEEVAIARERLSQLARAAAAAPAQPRFRKIRIPAALSSLGPTPNGPAGSFGARLSPDGKTLAFSSEGAIWTVPVPGKVSPDITGEPRKLTGAMFAMGLGLAWSADGRWVAFHAAREDGGEDIYVSPSKGGKPVRVASRPPLGLASYPYDSTLALSPDGGIVAFSSSEGESLCVKTVRVGDAALGCVTDPDTAEPAFSPDGRRLAYVKFYRRGATPPPGSPLSGIRVMPASGSGRNSVGVTDIPNRANRPLWSPDGRLIAFLGGPANRTDELWIVPVSDDGRGTAAPASFKMPRTTNLPLAGWTSDNKIGLVFESPTEQAIYTVPAEGGKATQITPQGAFEFPRWSPDGQSIWFLTADTASALGSVAAGGGAATTIRTGSNPPVQAVAGGVSVDSPDGTRVVFPGITKGVRGVNLWTMPEGGGQPTQLTDTPASALGAQQNRYPCWNPQSKSLFFVRAEGWTGVWYASTDIYVLAAGSGEARRITSASDVVTYNGIACSPDGGRVAYFSKDRTKPEEKAAQVLSDSIKVKAVDGGEPRIVARFEVTNQFGNEVAWSRDGRKLAFSVNGKMWVVAAEGGEPVQVETGLDARLQNVSWSPDGQKLAFMGIRGGAPELWLMEDFLPLVTRGRK